MDLVVRAVVIYFVLLLLLRVAGKRQFSEMTTFDLVLLLIVSEAISQPIFGSSEEYSLTGAVILVSTLVAIDILLSHAKRWIQPLDDVLESVPVLLIDDGQIIETNLEHERLASEDILEAARAQFGIERMSQVKYAILERNGSISVIPRGLPWDLPGRSEASSQTTSS